MNARLEDLGSLGPRLAPGVVAGVTGLHLPLGQMALSVVDLSGDGAGLCTMWVSSCSKAGGWPRGR